jgi:hypothetical protein
MSAKDKYHNAVKNALLKDGWTITDDPLRRAWGKKAVFVDLGAKRFLGTEKGDRKIAVEIKGFGGKSVVRDLGGAVGRYVLYHEVLRQTQADRALYLAVPQAAWENVFEEPLGKLLLDSQQLHLLVFSEQTGAIVKWIP